MSFTEPASKRRCLQVNSYGFEEESPNSCNDGVFRLGGVSSASWTAFPDSLHDPNLDQMPWHPTQIQPDHPDQDTVCFGMVCSTISLQPGNLGVNQIRSKLTTLRVIDCWNPCNRTEVPRIVSSLASSVSETAWSRDFLHDGRALFTRGYSARICAHPGGSP